MTSYQPTFTFFGGAGFVLRVFGGFHFYGLFLGALHVFIFLNPQGGFLLKLLHIFLPC